MSKFFFNFFLIAFFAVVFSSCRLFMPNRMFKTKVEYKVDSIQKALSHAEDRNYQIQKNDYLTIQVFSNGGERVVDPDYELSKGQGNIQRIFEPPRYLVRNDGYTRFPLIGNINLVGLTLIQTDTLLSREYSKYYENAFVVTKLANKRIVVFGPKGGKVLPLENDNISVIEAIALYGGIDYNGKAYNIRLIRGDLKNPDVAILDLSTIEGMKRANLNVEPNDIIYIETQRRILSESFSEVGPIISVITSIFVTILLIQRK